MLKDKSTLDFQALFDLSLFQGIDAQSVKKYLDNTSSHLLLKGEVLISPSSTSKNLYVVLSGLLSVHLNSPQSDFIAVINTGECAGEVSLFDKGAPSAYVVAAADSKILQITKTTIWDMIDNCEGFAKNLLYLVSSRIRESNQIMLNSYRMQQYYESRINIDSLTRLYNRRWIDQNIPQTYEACITNKTPVGLMMLDIDFFKKYNDDNGHLVGDTCLKVVANAIRNSIRPSDMLGRFGGEEFVILLPSATIQTCESVANRIKNNVEKIEITDNQLAVLPSVTISIGIAKGELNISYEDAFKVADAALYKAKKSGRNCIYYEA